MAELTCPKCGSVANRGGIPIWQIVVAIICFPIGLLALLAGPDPAKCTECGFRWKP